MRFKVILSVLFLLILGLSVVGFTVRGLPGNLTNPVTLAGLQHEASPFESSHERAPYAEMLSIKDRGTIQLSKPLADFGSPDVGHDGDRYFSFFPSGVAAVILPGYLIGSYYNLGQVGAYSVMGVISVMTMILLFLICRDVFELPVWAALTAPLTYAYATTSWSYAVTIYQHTPAAFVMAAMFYSVFRFKKSARQQVVWAALTWLLYGLSLFFDYPNGLLMLPIMFYFLINSLSIKAFKRRSKVVRLSINTTIVWTMVIFVATLIYHGYHNQKFLGHWSTIGNNLPRYVIKSDTQLKAEAQLAKQQSLKDGTDSAKLKQPKKKKNLSGILTEDNVPLNAKILLVGVDKGLFLFSPVLLMALLGIITIRSRQILEKSILLAFIIGDILIYSSFGDPYGGWAFGPRYLIPSMAALSIFVAIGLAQARLQTMRKVVYALLFFVSSAIALSGTLTTNLVPPKVEADYLKLKYYNFTHTFDLVGQNTSTSYVYNRYFSHTMSLTQYGQLIWSVLCILITIIIFIIPLFEVRSTPVEEQS